MNISVIGTGYVGLITGVCFAELGHDVVCVDVDAAKVAKIESGEPPIHEDGLADLLARHAGGRLRATTDLASAVHNTEVTMIAVGTPFGEDRIDLGQVEEVSRQIGRALGGLDRYHAVVVKSTVVPGTTEDVVLPILEETSGRRAGADFGVGMNPEFLREGEAIADFMHPDRIVLGAIDERTGDVMHRMYEAFAGGTDILRTTPRTAEMIKYAANSLLATLISFSNEMAAVCETTEGVDVQEVLTGVHLDKRFSPLLADGTRVRPGMLTYLEAGCGFGGSCFPKDVAAMAAYGRGAGLEMSMLSATLDINAMQPFRLVTALEEELGDLSGRRVAVLGLAFKPGTDDVRESPALTVIPQLRARGAQVRAYDPLAATATAAVLGDDDGVEYCDSGKAAVARADGVVLVTRWAEFEDLPTWLAGEAEPPVVVDGRRLIAVADVPRYRGIGLAGPRSR